MNRTSLAVKAVVSVFILAGVMGLIIFVAAGTFDYWQAWVYLAIFTIASLLTTIDLIRHDPDLLQRRMRGGPSAESRPAQRVIMIFTSLAFLGLLIVPALDHRFGEKGIPLYAVITGDFMVAIGFYFIFYVYRENTYTSATIQVIANQRVIDTGPYAIMRHPMYASALLYFLGTPLALSSYWGLLPFFFVIPFLMWRLVDEEKMLTKELEGYSEYQQRVRYRLVPGLW
jgi:protein-S-isoprenylcysteine O-methyltransferase Ste14